MLLNQIINIGVLISTTIAIGLGFIICYKFFKLNQMLNGLSRRLNNLGNEVSRESIEDFINYINEKYEPTRFYANDIIRAGYKLINMEEAIDNELKLRVKRAILSKGILVE